MTNLLIKTFIKNYKNTSDISVRSAYGKLAGLVGIICNIILCIAKIFAGIITSSISITADAVNNLSDAASSIISFLGFKLAEKPADKDHPYGHGRYEYLAGLVVTILIMVIGVELFRSSFNKILHPESMKFTVVTVIILIASILVKLWMAVFNNTVGKAINSKTLCAASSDSRNDVISTSAALVSLMVYRFTNINPDGYIGILIAAFILYSGLKLIKGTIDPMLGSIPDQETVNALRNKIMAYDKVLGTHDLMLHDYGPGRIFASAHVEMSANDDPILCHDIIDNIERDIKNEMKINIIIHYDPVIISDESKELTDMLTKTLYGIDEKLSFHDFRFVPGATHTNLIFDVVMPFDMKINEKQLEHMITEKVSMIDSSYYCIITVDKSYDSRL